MFRPRSLIWLRIQCLLFFLEHNLCFASAEFTVLTFSLIYGDMSRERPVCLTFFAVKAASLAPAGRYQA